MGNTNEYVSYIETNPDLKSEIDTYIQQMVNKKVKELAITAAENACKEYLGDRLAERVGIEVDKFETGRVEDAVAVVLKRYGIIPRVKESVDFDSVRKFLEEHPKIFTNASTGTNTEDVYNFYCEMCEEEDIIPVHKKTFSREINRLAGIHTKVKSINGKSVRVYTR